jgi:small subunit ribosomal protein S8e
LQDCTGKPSLGYGMARWHLRSGRKPTGGRLNTFRKRKRFERGTEFLEPKIGPAKKKTIKGRGKVIKTKLLSVDKINVSYGKNRKKVAKMVTVQNNEANPHYVRRNILTKGAVVKTDMGLVKVTSRPGQDGVVNGILVEENK